jgi:hypothetical protein
MKRLCKNLKECNEHPDSTKSGVMLPIPEEAIVCLEQGLIQLDGHS